MPTTDEALLLRPKDRLIVARSDQSVLEIKVFRSDGPDDQSDWLSIWVPGHVKIENAPREMRLSGSNIGISLDESRYSIDMDLDATASGGAVTLQVPVPDVGNFRKGKPDKYRFSPKTIRWTLKGGDVIITVVAVSDEGIRVQVEWPIEHRLVHKAFVPALPQGENIVPAPEPDSILDRVCEIVAEQMGIPRDQVTEDTNFGTDLGADSLDTVEMVMKFDVEFDITIPDEEVEKMLTPRKVVDYIKNPLP